MPYIKEEDRNRVDVGCPAEDAGELNYLITQLLLYYLIPRKFNYQGMNDCIGALESAKMEFYRRIVAPYEEAKRKENGDVYD